MSKFHRASFLVLLFSMLAGAQNGSLPGKWVCNWSGSVQRLIEGTGGGVVLAPQFRDAAYRGILNNQTIRIIVRSTVSGSLVRVRLSNAFGKQALTIAAAHIAAVPAGTMRVMGSSTGGRAVADSPLMTIPEQDKQIVGTDRAILFGGKPFVTIAPGGNAVSDPAEFQTADRTFIAVSLYLPDKTEPATIVGSATTAYVFEGDATAGTPGTPPRQRAPARGSYWLSGIDVFGSPESSAIVIIDDDSRWRDGLLPGAGWQEPFVQRLLSNGGLGRFAVLNFSIGDCPLIGICRSSVVQRIQETVRNRTAADWLIIAAGFDDILAATYDSGVRGQEPSNTRVEDIMGAFARIISEAHKAGLRVCGITYAPFSETPRYTEKGESMRQAVNAWIRTNRDFDAVADFDRALADPNKPDQRQPAFIGGNAAFFGYSGFQAMANSIDTSVFDR